MQGWELRARRREAGLTLDLVARAAGTSATNVSAYERSTKRPNAKTATRLLAAIDAGADSPIHRQHLLTLPAAAALLRRGLAEGWSTADLVRVVRQMRTDLAVVHTEADRAAFLAEPSTTGDRRWDLMLAGVVEDAALRADFAVPEWTRKGSLTSFWFVSPSPGLDAYVFARSPLSLQLRGVLVDPADLEAV